MSKSLWASAVHIAEAVASTVVFVVSIGNSSSRGSFSSVEQSSGTEKMRLGEVVDCGLFTHLAGRTGRILMINNLRRVKFEANLHLGRLESLLVAIDRHAKY